jgi:hypothetical protein
MTSHENQSNPEKAEVRQDTASDETVKQKSRSNQLDPEEVENRLDMAPPETVVELYALGVDILRGFDELFEYLDNKATKIAGYSGAIVALIVSTIGTWPKAIDPRMVPVILVAAMGALVAAGLAMSTTWPSELSALVRMTGCVRSC